MKEKTVKWKDYHHQIYQIYHGIIAFTLVPFALLFLEWDSGSTTYSHSSSESRTFLIIVSQLIWVVLYLSWYVWRGAKTQYKLNDTMTLKERLKEFKKRNLYKYILLAICGCLLTLAMWLGASYLFVIAYFGILVQYSFLRPSEDKFVRDMRVSKEDRKLLHQTEYK
ncbi:MAG: hypothetical protein AAFY41_16140 [Bacteroidota bacterium]